MASLALIGVEVKICEACLRTMEVDEEYETKCSCCGADICKNCAVGDVCIKCLNGW